MRLLSFILSLATCVIASAAELSIPNLSPIGWTPGVDVGVPGGIPAKIAARTVLHDVTQSPFSVVNDGSADVASAVTANISTVGTDEVLYFPYGVYRFDTPGYLGSRRITVRGAGMGVRSSLAVSSITRSSTTATVTTISAHGRTTGDVVVIAGADESAYNGDQTITVTGGSTFTFSVSGSPPTPATGDIVMRNYVTMGTGTKVFTVPAGLGWTAGIGARVWHAQTSYKWMQGTVTSYSGTTLTLNITSTSGDTDTAALWTVGQTVFYRTAAITIFSASTAASLGTANITGSPVAGATSITISDESPSWYWSAPMSAEIVKLKVADGEEYHHSGDPNTYNRFYNVVTSRVGDTLYLAYPLVVGLPAGQSPKIATGFTGGRDLGYEDFAAFGDKVADPYARQEILSLSSGWGCWMYRVEIGMENGATFSASGSVGSEVAYCIIGGKQKTADSSTKSSIVLEGSNYLLVRDSIIKAGLVVEGVPVFNVAFLRNYFDPTAVPVVNHGSGSRFFLFENNIATGIYKDGYHGGTQQYTVFRNLFNGSYAPHGNQAIVNFERYMREDNLVGNVIGVSGSVGPLISWGGAPGGSNSGTADPALYVSSGGASGSQLTHLDVSGNSRATGTATFSGDTATVTLDSYTLENQFTDPKFLGSANWALTLEWDSGYSTKYKTQTTIDRGASSGSTIILTGGVFIGATTFAPGTAVWPSNGTVVRIRAQEHGNREVDESVEGTLFKKENYIYGTGGAAGSIEDPTSDTLPDSLAESGRPSDLSPNIAWPIEISPDSPVIGTSVIPGQVRYLTGEWPESNTVYTPSFSPPAGTYATGSTQNVTITSATSGTTIYYTINGSTPTTGSTLYSTPVAITTTTTLKALAVKAGMDNSAIQSGTYTFVSAPTAPSGLGATAISTSQINLAWTDNSGDETSFRLERKVGAGAWSTVTSPAANATTYSNTGLTAATTYDYRVYAINVAGDSTVSNTASATTNSEGGGASVNATVNQLNVGTLNIP